MPSLEFPYTFLYYGAPSIQLRVSSESRGAIARRYAYIDTGAEVSLFDLSIANEIGLDVTNSPAISVSGVGGLIRQAVLVEVTLELLDEPELSVTLEVAFAPDVEQLHGNLLGLDVMEYFEFGLSHAQRLGYFEPARMIHAVIFDVGGPLDLEISHEAALDADIQAGLRREGFVFSEADWQEANRCAVDSFAPNLYRSVIWRLTSGELEASMRIYRWMEERSTKRDLFELRPGIAEILEALKARGLKLGLAANQPAKVLDTLAAQGIGDYFDHQGISGVYGLRKPDIRLFVRVCEDLGVKPGECIMVGDRIDNDIAPAKLLGMSTVRIRTGRHREQQPRSWDETPDAEVDDAASISRAIEALLFQMT